MIKITALDIDEGDEMIHYSFFANNEVCSAEVEFYGYDDSFKDFAEKLSNFPNKTNDKVKFEYGQKDDKYYSYLMLELHCFDPNGKSAIEVDLCNNGNTISRYEAKFQIIAEIASINKLGQSLKLWNPIKDSQFEWKPFSE
ncbi:hypothetical protein SCB49_00600 [unidentified eubacterium SCB49]|nr:hypothetical protein SCB49_00600 [unidentified eubacterium SCB49]